WSDRLGRTPVGHRRRGGGSGNTGKRHVSGQHVAELSGREGRHVPGDELRVGVVAGRGRTRWKDCQGDREDDPRGRSPEGIHVVVASLIEQYIEALVTTRGTPV